MNIIKIAVLSCIILFGSISYAQVTCDSIVNITSGYLNTKKDKTLGRIFISDGQVYRAFLDEDQSAEFEVTLYGGSTYRIASSAGTDDDYLIFNVYDHERNLLFSNFDYGNSPYWDFKIENTLDCIIEARLDNNKKLSGCAIMLIGFQKLKN